MKLFLKLRLNKSIEVMLDMKKQFLNNITALRLQKTPQSIIQKYIMMLDNDIRTMENSIKVKYANLENRYTKAVALLDSYSPLKTLSRGYSVASTKTGRVITKKDDVQAGDIIDIKLLDDKIEATVN